MATSELLWKTSHQRDQSQFSSESIYRFPTKVLRRIFREVMDRNAGAKNISYRCGFLLHRGRISVFCGMRTRSKRASERARIADMEDATNN